MLLAVGAGLPANSVPPVPAPATRPPVLRLTRIAPRCPRIAKSLGLFAHSVRVSYAAEREGGCPVPGCVPANVRGQGPLPQSSAHSHQPTLSSPQSSAHIFLQQRLQLDFAACLPTLGFYKGSSFSAAVSSSRWPVTEQAPGAAGNASRCKRDLAHGQGTCAQNRRRA